MAYTLPYPRSLRFAVVTCEDWEGNEYPRFATPGWRTCLRGTYRDGWDTAGPHVSMCADCGHLTYVTDAWELSYAIQEHYAAEHGYTPALLA